MAELADASDLKSGIHYGCAGSNPASATCKRLYVSGRKEGRVMHKPNNRLKSELKDNVSEVKIRTCLKCSGEFSSTGPGNRLCAKCRAKNHSIRSVL